MSFTVDDIYDLPDKLYQPHHLSFPTRKFGKASPVCRSFQSGRFNRFTCIHYDVPRDATFCLFAAKQQRKND